MVDPPDDAAPRTRARRNTDPGAAQRYRVLAVKARLAATRTRVKSLRATYEALAVRYDELSRDLALPALKSRRA
jgi:hypothetical protein